MSNSLGSLTKHVPGDWWVIALVVLALPLVSMFLIPGLRLGGVIMQAAATIGSALIICLSSWCVLFLNYVTALSRALQPGRGLEPYLKPIGLTVAGIAVVYGLSFITIPGWFYLAATGAATLLGLHKVSIALARRSLIPAVWVPRIRVGLLCVACAGAILQFSISHQIVYSAETNVNACLSNGTIDTTCLRNTSAQPF